MELETIGESYTASDGGDESALISRAFDVALEMIVRGDKTFNGAIFIPYPVSSSEHPADEEIIVESI